MIGLARAAERILISEKRHQLFATYRSSSPARHRRLRQRRSETRAALASPAGLAQARIATLSSRLLGHHGSQVPQAAFETNCFTMAHESKPKGASKDVTWKTCENVACKFQFQVTDKNRMWYSGSEQCRTEWTKAQLGVDSFRPTASVDRKKQ